MSIIMKGAPVAKKIQENLEEEVLELKRNGKNPSMTFVRVGHREDDLVYQRSAQKRMNKIGIECNVLAIEEDAPEEEVIRKISEVNADPSVDGILLFRPLPHHLHEEILKNCIDPKKDVDGMRDENISKIFDGNAMGFAPCTAEAVVELLDYYGIETAGKNAVIIGRSRVIGKPVSMLLLTKDATITICHRKTENLEEICKRADILVVAAGCKNIVTADMVSDKCYVIDVGINVNADGDICGDVDYEVLKDKVAGITPVPGGVGGITTAILANHVVRAAKGMTIK